MTLRGSSLAGPGIIPVGGPAGLPGQSTYQAWLTLPGNAGKALADKRYDDAIVGYELLLKEFAGNNKYQLPSLYNEGLAQITALMTDEMLNAETYNTRIEVDRRAITNINSSTLQTFQVAQQARATADLVSGRYREFDPNNSQGAEVQALAAFMYVMFAESYCNGVPTSRVLPDGSFEYGAPQSGTQLLTAAIAKFDSAITVALTMVSGALCCACPR